MPEHTVTFTSGGHTLAGTLGTPEVARPFPAVLLLPGSGPMDRNSDHRRMPLSITAQLADALDPAGLATFRYDKRGVGASTGRWHSAGFHDNRDDAAAALKFLRAYPGVDPARVVLLGHSEGALHAAGLAARGERTAGLVLLSCSATPGEDLLRWQSAQTAPTLPTPVRVLLRLLRTDLARVGVPVLAVTGSKDLEVPATDLATIHDLVGAPVETHDMPDLSHILRTEVGPASLSGTSARCADRSTPGSCPSSSNGSPLQVAASAH